MKRNVARSLSFAVLLCMPTVLLAADILWPSFMWTEPNNAPVLMLLKEKFEQENPGNTVKNVTVPIAVFWDKQFADVAERQRRRYRDVVRPRSARVHRGRSA